MCPRISGGSGPESTWTPRSDANGGKCIYVYIEREGEIHKYMYEDKYVCIYIYIYIYNAHKYYIYIYICISLSIYIYIERERDNRTWRRAGRGRRGREGGVAAPATLAAKGLWGSARAGSFASQHGCGVRALPASVNKNTPLEISNTPPEINTYRKIGFWSTKSGAGLQFPPKDYRAKDGTKGVLFSQTPVSHGTV